MSAHFLSLQLVAFCMCLRFYLHIYIFDYAQHNHSEYMHSHNAYAHRQHAHAQPQSEFSAKVRNAIRSPNHNTQHTKAHAKYTNNT